MLVRGRRVYPRHLFPEFVAPWIHLRRLRLRVVWFFTTPIHVVPLWTTSVVAGILGVMLTILLFRSTPQAPAATLAASVSALPTVPSDLAPIASFSFHDPADPRWNADVALETGLHWTKFRQRFDQSRQLTTRSRPGRRSLPSLAAVSAPDGWRRTNQFRTSAATTGSIPYAETAILWRPPAVGTVASSDQPATFGGQPESQPGLRVTCNSATGTQPDASDCTILIRNVGNDVLRDLLVTQRVVDIRQVTQVVPPADVSADALHWRIEELAPGREQRLVVTMVPHSGAIIQSQAEVRATVAVSSSTRVTAPQAAEPLPRSSIPGGPAQEEQPQPLHAEPATAVSPASNEFAPPRRAFQGAPRLVVEAELPESIRTGEELSMVFAISNVGDGDADDVVLTVYVPQLLEHHDGQLVEHRVPHLPAGTTRRARFRALARVEGAAALSAQLESRQGSPEDWSGLVKVIAARVNSVSQKPPLDGRQPTAIQTGAEISHALVQSTAESPDAMSPGSR